MRFSRLQDLVFYAFHTPERPRYEWRTMRPEWIDQDDAHVARYAQMRRYQATDVQQISGPR